MDNKKARFKSGLGREKRFLPLALHQALKQGIRCALRGALGGGDVGVGVVQEVFGFVEALGVGRGAVRPIEIKPALVSEEAGGVAYPVVELLHVCACVNRALTQNFIHRPALPPVFVDTHALNVFLDALQQRLVVFDFGPARVFVQQHSHQVPARNIQIGYPFVLAFRPKVSVLGKG